MMWLDNRGRGFGQMQEYCSTSPRYSERRRRERPLDLQWLVGSEACFRAETEGRRREESGERKEETNLFHILNYNIRYFDTCRVPKRL